MKCPVCGEYTVSVECHDEEQGEAPMSGWVTFVDNWELECDCVLTEEQLKELEDNLICDEPNDDY